MYVSVFQILMSATLATTLVMPHVPRVQILKVATHAPVTPDMRETELPVQVECLAVTWLILLLQAKYN